MDIDDILAELDGQTIPQETLDLQALTRAWVSERVGPEIMPYPERLMERTMDRIRRQVCVLLQRLPTTHLVLEDNNPFWLSLTPFRPLRQIEVVETQTGNMDPKTNFRLIVIQTELERFKFLVRSLLRARIAKIDKHPLHILSSPELKARLSPSELRYLTQHQTLLHTHYLSSFLSNFPEQLRRLDDTAGGISMIERPDLDTVVFVRVLRDVDLARTEGGGGGGDLSGEGGRLGRGEVCVVRYSLVREAVLRADVELI
ncbi:MAG: GINS complex subunit [Peltula sp. TS41687]|nr:MAG: GINS complex subunit [Peltula sp. TS41687]